MLRILIIDDHTVVRHGILRILADEIKAAEIGEGADANQALTLLRNHTWDLVILDVSLPGRSGLDVLADIRYSWPKLPVLMLSMYPEDEIAVRLLKAGASGYLVKNSASEELIKAVRKVLAGGRYVSEALADQLVMALDSNIGEALPHARLSTREFEVMLMIAAGRRIGEIATDLTLSVKTVSTYHARILEKMNMDSDAALITYCVRRGLVE